MSGRHAKRVPIRLTLDKGGVLIMPGDTPLATAKALRDRCNRERCVLLPRGADVVPLPPDPGFPSKAKRR